MDTELEPPWAGEIRRALRSAVRQLQGESTSDEIKLHFQAALEAGWKIPEDGYKDFWATARKITEASGSIKQFPINEFFAREVQRMAQLENA